MASIVPLTPTQIADLTKLVFDLIEQNLSLANSIPALQQQQADFQQIDDDFKVIHEAIESGAIIDFELERRYLTGPFVLAVEEVTEAKIQLSVTEPYEETTTPETHPLYPDPGFSPPAAPVQNPRPAVGLFGGTGVEPAAEATVKGTESADITTLRNTFG